VSMYALMVDEWALYRGLTHLVVLCALGMGVSPNKLDLTNWPDVGKMPRLIIHQDTAMLSLKP